MQVFKAYFRVMKKHTRIIMIYIIIFVVLAVVISSLIGGQSATTSFSETKYNIALFNEDVDAPLTQGLVQYIGKNATFVDIGSREEDVQDALFYGSADCVVTIPQGFAKDFMNGGSPQIVKRTSAGKPASIYMDFMLNKYLNMAALYAKNMPEATQVDIAGYVAADLENTAAVDLTQSAPAEEPNPVTYYFRFVAYSLLAAMMMGVSLVMMSFNEENLSNRMACAPLKPLRMNLQMVLANVVFALVLWVAMCVFTLVSGSAKLDTSTILLCLNALVFTLVSLCIGFMMGKFVKNHGVQAAVTNVVSLGMSFISGVFVEQALLGKTVQTIGSFTPTYWYIRAVDAIGNMTVVNTGSLQPVVEGMLIQLGFAAAILIVTLAISKQRRKAAV